MSCRRSKGLISRYLDGELPAQEALRLERHLAECPGCRGELQALRDISSWLHALTPPPAPADLLEQVLTEARSAPASSLLHGWIEGWKAWSRLMRFAAAGAAVMALWLGLLLSGGAGPARPLAEATWLKAASAGPLVAAYEGISE